MYSYKKFTLTALHGSNDNLYHAFYFKDYNSHKSIFQSYKTIL